jgi:hypothetical protein
VDSVRTSDNFPLTKQQWGDIHFDKPPQELTIIHLIIDWQALKACARYLLSPERRQGPCE